MRTDSVNMLKKPQVFDAWLIADMLSCSRRKNGIFDQGQGRPGGSRGHSSGGYRYADCREGVAGEEVRLYDLIWKRTVATQMANAKIALTTARLAVFDPENQHDVTFRASGRQVVFPGFFRAYVEGSDDPEAVLDDKDQPLPAFEEGDPLTCSKIEALGHETRPPSRFTEATLVKCRRLRCV